MEAKAKGRKEEGGNEGRNGEMKEPIFGCVRRAGTPTFLRWKLGLVGTRKLVEVKVVRKKTDDEDKTVRLASVIISTRTAVVVVPSQYMGRCLVVRKPALHPLYSGFECAGCSVVGSAKASTRTAHQIFEDRAARSNRMPTTFDLLRICVCCCFPRALSLSFFFPGTTPPYAQVGLEEDKIIMAIGGSTRSQTPKNLHDDDADNDDDSNHD